jgi:hypothetical protein
MVKKSIGLSLILFLNIDFFTNKSYNVLTTRGDGVARNGFYRLALFF